MHRQLLDEFAAEALEHLDAADSVLGTLEAGSADGLDQGARAELLRAMHSIKGAAGYLGLSDIQRLSHGLETAAQQLWERAMVDDFRLELLLDGTSELRRLVELAGKAVTPSLSLLAALEATEEALPSTRRVTDPPGRRSLEDVFFDVATQQVQAMQAACQQLSQDPHDATGLEMVRRAFSALSSAAEYAGHEEVIELLGECPPPDEGLELSAIQRVLALLGERLASRQAPEALSLAPGSISEPASLRNGTADSGTQPSSETGGTLRVAQARVDLLIERAGELVTIRNQLDHFLGSLDSDGNGAAAYRRGRALGLALGRITEGLQSLAIELRLMRLEVLFRRLPRVAHDVARHTGKSVHMETEGGETELDKGIAEALADPLIHLVRNAIDHGVESSAERTVLGKPPRGLVRVGARREANHVIVTVEDDGRGVDPELVRTAAVKRGWLDAKTADALSMEGVHDLLFQPAFSTAHAVTEISGRGVGLDVVRQNVCRLGGSVAMSSRSGAGTTVEMRLPVRLAAREVILVRVGGGSYAIPLEGVQETLLVSADRLRRVVGRPAILNRGRVVPLASLAQLLGIEDLDPQSKDVQLVLINAGEQTVGLVVGEICGHCQVVVRPLDSYLAPPGIDGAAVLGDGRVVMVIDPTRLAAGQA